jgi:hypothetical protein
MIKIQAERRVDELLGRRGKTEIGVLEYGGVVVGDSDYR